MEKSLIIRDFCSEILEYPVTLNEEITENLLVAAGLVEDAVTRAGCDVLDRTSMQHAEYIRRHISVCTRKVLDDVYFLLFELPGSTVH